MTKLMAKAKARLRCIIALAGFRDQGGRTYASRVEGLNFARGILRSAADKAKTATRRLAPILPISGRLSATVPRASGTIV